MATSTNSKGAAIVSSEKILVGVFFALRQAWELLSSAQVWWRPWISFDSTRSSREILEAETAYILRRYELEALKTKVSRTDVVFGNSLHLPPEVASP
ncbi:MAG: hypothetical protein DMG32_19875 [Acidobacteria bacterium]|nr:MAG: hypothetical protein DMG32_19875 [Acidobacteriota bacterium]